MKVLEQMSAHEALYGFCGWLTSRKEQAVMSSSDDCAPIAELIKEFCDNNNITEEK